MSRVGGVSKVASDTMASLSLSLQGASSPTATPAPAYVDYQLLCKYPLLRHDMETFIINPYVDHNRQAFLYKLSRTTKLSNPIYSWPKNLKYRKKENILMFILRLHHYIMLYQHYMITEI